MKGETTMLSKTNYRIEDLMVPVTALTKSEVISDSESYIRELDEEEKLSVQGGYCTVDPGNGPSFLQTLTWLFRDDNPCGQSQPVNIVCNGGTCGFEDPNTMTSHN